MHVRVPFAVLHGFPLLSRLCPPDFQSNQGQMDDYKNSPLFDPDMFVSKDQRLHGESDPVGVRAVHPFPRQAGCPRHVQRQFSRLSLLHHVRARVSVMVLRVPEKFHQFSESPAADLEALPLHQHFRLLFLRGFRSPS